MNDSNLSEETENPLVTKSIYNSLLKNDDKHLDSENTKDIQRNLDEHLTSEFNYFQIAFIYSLIFEEIKKTVKDKSSEFDKFIDGLISNFLILILSSFRKFYDFFKNKESRDFTAKDVLEGSYGEFWNDFKEKFDTCNYKELNKYINKSALHIDKLRSKDKDSQRFNWNIIEYYNDIIEWFKLFEKHANYSFDGCKLISYDNVNKKEFKKEFEAALELINIDSEMKKEIIEHLTR